MQVVAAAAVLALASPVRAATDIMLWHAMSGELGRQLEKLTSDFNTSQSDYRIVPSYKGNYTETVTAAIFAFRSRSQPAIVQVNEVATATMTAAKGAIYPVFELMRDQHEPFSPGAYLRAVSGYYQDAAGNLLSFPFNASTPILYYNKAMFRDAGLDPETPPKTWPELGAAAKRLRERGTACGFTTSWPSWIHVENFSAFHNLPLATRANGFAGLDAELTINNPGVVRHVARLAEWQKDKVFDYSGRGQAAEPRFQNGECGIFVGSSATRADIKANSKFEVGYGMMPYWPDVAGAPLNSIIGGATLWVLRDRPRDEYKGVARFFAYLSQPGVQAAWHQNTGYLPITRAAFELTRSQGFYERNPGAAISFEEITLHPPTENSKGIRLGSFVLIRGAIEDELEQAFSGEKPAQAALDAAVERGNKLLRQFERASPDR
ncbi:sn-glycerol-3-phosphate ABC transporter substrate-binding protein UgpB [Bradyrhizobium sp.]|uniref:sn-glycerol-3-phosphate ABC transporter substrate-binding protein UgpB n=1 Tax=Bradyrhizobium sp. TaxID=376 RepID=UPI0023A1416F|nr:sn-glycerol-3-phosphate ABC transporter substrate-binding protein UgpB [Bradyrhizobium sp.]MDE2375800.1 sn-glycerol-3-phosphate ABC transporter substrate-binding protein UgpB [Bradyrhizobium sp.]